MGKKARRAVIFVNWYWECERPGTGLQFPSLTLWRCFFELWEIMRPVTFPEIYCPSTFDPVHNVHMNLWELVKWLVAVHISSRRLLSAWNRLAGGVQLFCPFRRHIYRVVIRFWRPWKTQARCLCVELVAPRDEHYSILASFTLERGCNIGGGERLSNGEPSAFVCARFCRPRN